MIETSVVDRAAESNSTNNCTKPLRDDEIICVFKPQEQYLFKRKFERVFDSFSGEKRLLG
jgi:hypothetical protein